MNNWDLDGTRVTSPSVITSQSLESTALRSHTTLSVGDIVPELAHSESRGIVLDQHETHVRSKAEGWGVCHYWLVIAMNVQSTTLDRTLVDCRGFNCM